MLYRGYVRFVGPGSVGAWVTARATFAVPDPRLAYALARESVRSDERDRAEVVVLPADLEPMPGARKG